MICNPNPANVLIHLRPNYSFQETFARLETAVRERGLRLFTRTDHSASPAEAEVKMRPSEVQLFGNPTIGTPMILAAPTSAIDLPVKSVVCEDSCVEVWLTYNATEDLVNCDDVSKSPVGELKGLVELLQKVVN